MHISASNTFDAIVIGAGLGGLTCAKRLADAGHRVLLKVFEARHGHRVGAKLREELERFPSRLVKCDILPIVVIPAVSALQHESYEAGDPIISSPRCGCEKSKDASSFQSACSLRYIPLCETPSFLISGGNAIDESRETPNLSNLRFFSSSIPFILSSCSIILALSGKQK